MGNLCKWEVLRSNSYGASYKCLNCGDFHEEFSDGESIILPPLKVCKSTPKKFMPATSNQ